MGGLGVFDGHGGVWWVNGARSQVMGVLVRQAGGGGLRSLADVISRNVYLYDDGLYQRKGVG
jgi:hypothetical protein